MRRTLVTWIRGAVLALFGMTVLGSGLVLAVSGQNEAQDETKQEAAAEEAERLTATAEKDTHPAWKPTPPMPRHFDWIELNSGEWLKGEFKSLYEDSVEFESDELNTLTLDWSDIKQVRSFQIMQVWLLSREIVVGKMYLEGDSVRIIGDEERDFKRSQIVSITAGAPKEINYWNFKVGLGTNIRQGNSDIVESYITVFVMRRTPQNRASLDYKGNYNVTEDIVAANNHRASIVWDKFLTDRFFLKPIFFEFFVDPFQNIAHRETIGVGAGYDIADTKKVDWQVSGGPAYQNTTFDSVPAGTPESEDTPALVVGTYLEVEVNKNVDYDFEYRFQITNDETGSYNHHIDTGFETEISSLLDFDIAFIWDRIEKPRPDEDGNFPLQDDFRMLLALNFEW